MKFNIQDRIVLDEMVDTFKAEMIKQHHEYDLDGKRPIITKEYWLQMIDEVQNKILTQRLHTARQLNLQTIHSM